MPDPSASTWPLISLPRTAGSLGSQRYTPVRNRKSGLPTPMACARTSTRPAPALGRGTSTVSKTSGPPGTLTWIACTHRLRLGRNKVTGPATHRNTRSRRAFGLWLSEECVMADTRTAAFVFDLDGTLVDSVYQHVLAWHKALQQVG